MPHLASNDIALEDFPAFADEVLRLTQAGGEPFDGHMAMLRAVYLAAHKAGITVMLDGAGGDTTLMADDMVAWRLRRGDIIGAWREAAGARRFWGEQMPSLKSFVSGARYLVVPEWLRTLRRRAGAGPQQRRKDQASMVAPELARRVDLAERRAANARHGVLKLDGRCEDRRALVTHPLVAVARERYDRVAAPLGIVPRDPFLDRRLVKFCLALPPNQIEHDGWPKIVLRRAMVGVLPDAVRWRSGKEHLGGQFEDAVIERFLAESGSSLTTGLEPFVKSGRLAMAESHDRDALAVATRTTMSYLKCLQL
jgi:asparagine synthase (glutamine-hydrolysing)